MWVSAGVPSAIPVLASLLCFSHWEGLEVFVSRQHSMFLGIGTEKTAFSLCETFMRAQCVGIHCHRKCGAALSFCHPFFVPCSVQVRRTCVNAGKPSVRHCVRTTRVPCWLCFFIGHPNRTGAGARPVNGALEMYSMQENLHLGGKLFRDAMCLRAVHQAPAD